MDLFTLPDSNHRVYHSYPSSLCLPFFWSKCLPVLSLSSTTCPTYNWGLTSQWGKHHLLTGWIVPLCPYQPWPGNRLPPSLDVNQWVTSLSTHSWSFQKLKMLYMSILRCSSPWKHSELTDWVGQSVWKEEGLSPCQARNSLAFWPSSYANSKLKYLLSAALKKMAVPQSWGCELEWVNDVRPHVVILSSQFHSLSSGQSMDLPF